MSDVRGTGEVAAGIAAARDQLRALAERGLKIAYQAQGTLVRGQGLRRSAVLILFGALDAAPAEAPHCAVPAALDVLLTRRSDTMRYHAGQIAFPGGGAEHEDVDMVATALREAAEETGLDPAGVEALGVLPEIHVPVSNNLVTPVLGWWRHPTTVAADEQESVEVFRVPVAELLDPAQRGTSVLHREGVTYRGAAFELHERFRRGIVWGFTGMLLASVFDGLNWSVPWDHTREIPIALADGATS